VSDETTAAAEAPAEETPAEPKKWTKPKILAAVLEGELTKTEAAEILATMKANKPPRKPKPRELYCGDKGTICLRGVRKFPVLNLYPEEIEKVAEVWDEVLEFTALVKEIEPEKRKDVEGVVVEPAPPEEGEAETPAEEGEAEGEAEAAAA